MPGDPFYSSPAWRLFRRGVLADKPVCSVVGCQLPGKHLDHMLSRRMRPDLALERSNVNPLCHAHHSQKTARRDGGFGNRRGNSAIVVRGAAVDGTPLDPGHRWNKA